MVGAELGKALVPVLGLVSRLGGTCCCEDLVAAHNQADIGKEKRFQPLAHRLLRVAGLVRAVDFLLWYQNCSPPAMRLGIARRLFASSGLPACRADGDRQSHSARRRLNPSHVARYLA